MERHLYPRCPLFERSGRQCHRSPASLLLAAISSHKQSAGKFGNLPLQTVALPAQKLGGTKIEWGLNVWFKANNTILFVIPPLKAQMTICSKNLRGTWPPRPSNYAYACRRRSGHEWTACSALHDTRTVNLALLQCECRTGK